MLSEAVDIKQLFGGPDAIVTDSGRVLAIAVATGPRRLDGIPAEGKECGRDREREREREREKSGEREES